MKRNIFNFWRTQSRETSEAGKTDGQVSGGTFEANIRRPSSPGAALTISAVYRAIELRARTVGQFQMQFQRLNREGGNFVVDMGSPTTAYASSGQRLNYLLQVEPNPIMTATQMFQLFTINKLQRGNGFIYIERDDMGEVRHLWLATCGGYNQAANTYCLSYMSDRGIENIAAAPASDVIHVANTFRDQNGYNGFMGVSTLRYALETLTLIATQKAQSLETAAKGGRMKLIIGEDTSRVQSPISAGMFDPKQMQDYASEVQDHLYRNDVVALRALDKVQNISMTAADQQMIEMLGMTQDDVARFYGTPRPLLMMDSNSHYNTYVNATMEYMTRTIAPDVLEIEQEFARKLLNVYDFGRYRFHMCEQPLMRLDKEAQAKVDKMRLEAGTATINELRKQYDMPAIDKGDTPYISTNLAEVGSEKLSGKTATPEPPKATEPEPPAPEPPAGD